MKIVCDNCATKYSIADEKVRGKVFKIRCKKCSHIIVVRGTEGDAPQAVDHSAGHGDNAFGEDQATVAQGGGGGAADSVWHLVIDREQVGPMTASEVRAKVAAGQADAETYAWREGFGDWLRLGSIDDFKDLAAAPAGRVMHEAATQVPASNDEATRRSDMGDLFGGQPREEEGGASDLFGGKAAAQPASASFAQAASTGEDLFGGGGQAASPLFSAPAPEARPRASAGQFGGGGGGGLEAAPAGEPKMTGQRNENSVLFSLNNLQALATGGGAKASAPAASEAQRPGYASSKSEGSGLIDIRAMAAQTLSAAPSPSSGGELSDLPAFSAAPVFSPVVAAPILMPSPSSGMPKWVWGVIGGGGLVVVAMVVLVVVVLTRSGRPVDVPPTTIALNTNPNPASGTSLGALEKGLEKAAGAEKAAAEKAAAEKPPEKAAEKEKSGSRKVAAAGSRHERSKKDDPLGLGASSPSSPSAAPAEKPSKPKRGGDDLDALLDGATGGRSEKRSAAPREAPPPPADDPSLPEQLQRGDIVSGMSAVSSRVHGCFEQYKVPGTAMVALVIAKSGRVQSANVQGALAGTPTGDCVGRAVKGASFKKFRGSSMSISYPFILR
jgi:predicted Zn finger-like uncharacterized protein